MLTYTYSSGTLLACSLSYAWSGNKTRPAHFTADPCKLSFLGLLDLTSSSELIREYNSMSWQCTAASHSMHGYTAVPGFGSPPAMLLPLFQLETECNSLEGNSDIFFLLWFTLPEHTALFYICSRPLTNQQRAVCLLRAHNMKSLTRKKKSQVSLQSPKHLLDQLQLGTSLFWVSWAVCLSAPWMQTVQECCQKYGE